jgi:hypothetical protein
MEVLGAEKRRKHAKLFASEEIRKTNYFFLTIGSLII